MESDRVRGLKETPDATYGGLRTRVRALYPTGSSEIGTGWEESRLFESGYLERPL